MQPAQHLHTRKALTCCAEASVTSLVSAIMHTRCVLLSALTLTRMSACVCAPREHQCEALARDFGSGSAHSGGGGGGGGGTAAGGLFGHGAGGAGTWNSPGPGSLREALAGVQDSIYYLQVRA
jgi:hypothetical protein